MSGSESNDSDTLRDYHKSVLNGVKQADIDWFLRDSNIDGEIKTIDTNISNSNSNNQTKTKPSLSPVHGENVTRRDSDTKSNSRRNTITSLSSNGSSGGFFLKLKDKFKLDSQHHHNHNGTSHPQSPEKSSADPKPIFKSNYSISAEPDKLEDFPSTTSDDPRLDEYIKFYQKPDNTFRRKSSTSSHCPLPSALIENPLVKVHSNPAPRKDSATKFSLFKRKNEVQDPNPSVTSFTSVESNTLPEFKDLKPLKRVAFHSSTFLIDPPQQIPSRNPRRGNVFSENGKLVIIPLTEEDKIMMTKSQLGQGGGIVVGGSGALGLLDKEEGDSEESSISIANGEQSPDNDEDPDIDDHMKNVAIDKPIVRSQPDYYSAPIKKMALDLMYTRCCHLREILPIPAILKQIPKGSMAPIPLLQLRNPYPTLVEVQTFADFIRIAPIVCVSFDGVNLSLKQFQILLSAMAAKSQLEKLSLRNTPINHEGWSLLCWFLSRNRILRKLDITQCLSLSVNTLKKKKKKTEVGDNTIRMTCNKENRSEMDWSLFVATMVARGGVDELILTGCCINDLEIFEKLIKVVVSKHTARLGLAYNKLSAKQFKILVDNWLFSDIAKGIDLGYNDFLSRQMLQILLEKKSVPAFDSIISKAGLMFVSLNSTNLRFLEFKNILELILMKLPQLKYIDLSNNTRLFGTTTPETIGNGKLLDSDRNTSPSAIISYFNSKLPLFPSLARLHLDYNNYSTDSIIEIAKVLPFCKHLSHFSIAGNEISISAASALIQAVKNSSTLITLDCDYSGFPKLFKETLGLYTMRNMENILVSSNQEMITDKEESETLTEQLNKILAVKAENKLDLNSLEVVKFIQRANKIRSELQKTINELLDLQLRNELNFEGKETLIRFIFLDSSIETGLQLIDSSVVENSDVVANALFTLSAEDEKSKFIPKETYSGEDPIAVADGDGDLRPLSSKSNSRTNLDQLNREEGSMLKLLSLHKFHHPRDETTADPFEDVSGEQIRQKIMSVDFKDVDQVIKYMNILKERGITILKVYNESGVNSDDYLDLLRDNSIKFDALNKKLKDLSNLDLTDLEISKSESPTENGEKDDDGEAIIKAYDKYLNTVKNRFTKGSN